MVPFFLSNHILAAHGVWSGRTFWAFLRLSIRDILSVQLSTRASLSASRGTLSLHFFCHFLTGSSIAFGVLTLAAFLRCCMARSILERVAFGHGLRVFCFGWIAWIT